MSWAIPRRPDRDRCPGQRYLGRELGVRASGRALGERTRRLSVRTRNSSMGRPAKSALSPIAYSLFLQVVIHSRIEEAARAFAFSYLPANHAAGDSIRIRCGLMGKIGGALPGQRRASTISANSRIRSGSRHRRKPPSQVVAKISPGLPSGAYSARYSQAYLRYTKVRPVEVRSRPDHGSCRPRQIEMASLWRPPVSLPSPLCWQGTRDLEYLS